MFSSKVCDTESQIYILPLFTFFNHHHFCIKIFFFRVLYITKLFAYKKQLLVLIINNNVLLDIRQENIILKSIIVYQKEAS